MDRLIFLCQIATIGHVIAAAAIFMFWVFGSSSLADYLTVFGASSVATHLAAALVAFISEDHWRR